MVDTLHITNSLNCELSPCTVWKSRRNRLLEKVKTMGCKAAHCSTLTDKICPITIQYFLQRWKQTTTVCEIARNPPMYLSFPLMFLPKENQNMILRITLAFRRIVLCFLWAQCGKEFREKTNCIRKFGPRLCIKRWRQRVSSSFRSTAPKNESTVLYKYTFWIWRDETKSDTPILRKVY